MLDTKNHKRRIVHFAKKPLLKKETRSCSHFKEELKRFQGDWEHLFEKETLATDHKFLRKMAIAIKQMQHEAKSCEASGEKVRHFLETPIGAPFVSKITLAQAADRYSEQEPKHSDLSELLRTFARYSKHFHFQILTVFHD
jgi:hypothetical protein